MKLWQLAAIAGFDLMDHVLVEDRPFVPTPERPPLPIVNPQVTIY